MKRIVSLWICVVLLSSVAGVMRFEGNDISGIKAGNGGDKVLMKEKIIDIFNGEPGNSVLIVRKPLDVVFALDTSGSMAGTDLTNLKTATKNFIGMMTDIDRAAIWKFAGSPNTNPQLSLAWAYMTAANRTSFNATIDAFAASGNTPFYDTLGEAISYSLTYDSNASEPSRLEFVVAFTDGESNCDDYWTPEANWGENYTGSDPQGYANGGDYVTGNGFEGGIGHGLINSPPMVFTIGLGIQHDPQYPTAPDWSRIPPRAAYAVEYDLWHSADSTPTPEGKYGYNGTSEEPFVGHYYYMTDSSQLPNIFECVYDIIEELSTINESPEPHYDINLSIGWNMISIPLFQNNTTVQTVLTSIAGKWNVIQTYNSTDPVHWKSNCTFKPDSLNDLKTIDNKIGFWIHMTEPNVVLTVYGSIPNSTSINLKTGWNLVGYPSLVQKSISNALLGTGYDSVEGFNASEPYRTSVLPGGYLMKPGEAYWVHVPADHVWVVDW